MSERLALEDFLPRQALRVPVHEVPLPRFPVIDAHNHLGVPFGGDWSTRTAAELASTMDASGVERIVEITLNAAEKKQFQHSVGAVRTLIQECERLEKAEKKRAFSRRGRGLMAIKIPKQ